MSFSIELSGLWLPVYILMSNIIKIHIFFRETYKKCLNYHAFYITFLQREAGYLGICFVWKMLTLHAIALKKITNLRK